ncbi:hypothetical protein N7492_003258 [Penicillium capsulatum]|uniref:Uncharacterized protein n=1 Tax=Penicillium capsulatum TaxID=69766 RepID=A0A9W9IKZ6_9EURO|nr:hypothetical protein N7492_003258 [Penicillium capsulatum]
MCLLKILDHTGSSGCGHIYVTGVEQCYTSRCRPDGSLCIYPKHRRIVPNTGTYGDYVRWFVPGHSKVAGQCPECWATKGPRSDALG